MQTHFSSFLALLSVGLLVFGIAACSVEPTPTQAGVGLGDAGPGDGEAPVCNPEQCTPGTSGSCIDPITLKCSSVVPCPSELVACGTVDLVEWDLSLSGDIAFTTKPLRLDPEESIIENHGVNWGQRQFVRPYYPFGPFEGSAIGDGSAAAPGGNVVPFDEVYNFAATDSSVATEEKNCVCKSFDGYPTENDKPVWPNSNGTPWPLLSCTSDKAQGDWAVRYALPQSLEGGFLSNQQFVGNTLSYRPSAIPNCYNLTQASSFWGWDHSDLASPAQIHVGNPDFPRSEEGQPSSTGVNGWVQLSPHLIMPPTGLSWRRGTADGIVGIEVLALPLANSETGVPQNWWTITLKAANFEGALMAFSDAYWIENTSSAVFDPSDFAKEVPGQPVLPPAPAMPPYVDDATLVNTAAAVTFPATSIEYNNIRGYVFSWVPAAGESSQTELGFLVLPPMQVPTDTPVGQSISYYTGPLQYFWKTPTSGNTQQVAVMSNNTGDPEYRSEKSRLKPGTKVRLTDESGVFGSPLTIASAFPETGNSELTILEFEEAHDAFAASGALVTFNPPAGVNTYRWIRTEGQGLGLDGDLTLWLYSEAQVFVSEDAFSDVGALSCSRSSCKLTIASATYDPATNKTALEFDGTQEFSATEGILTTATDFQNWLAAPQSSDPTVAGSAMQDAKKMLAASRMAGQLGLSQFPMAVSDGKVSFDIFGTIAEGQERLGLEAKGDQWSFSDYRCQNNGDDSATYPCMPGEDLPDSCDPSSTCEKVSFASWPQVWKAEFDPGTNQFKEDAELTPVSLSDLKSQYPNVYHEVKRENLVAIMRERNSVLPLQNQPWPGGGGSLTISSQAPGAQPSFYSGRVETVSYQLDDCYTTVVTYGWIPFEDQPSLASMTADRRAQLKQSFDNLSANPEIFGWSDESPTGSLLEIEPALVVLDQSAEHEGMVPIVMQQDLCSITEATASGLCPADTRPTPDACQAESAADRL